MKLGTAAKAFVGAATAALTTALGLVADGDVSLADVIYIALAALGTFGTVWVAPNLPSEKQLAPHEQAQADLEARILSVETQLPSIPDLADAVKAGVLAARPSPRPQPVPGPAPVATPAELDPPREVTKATPRKRAPAKRAPRARPTRTP